MHGTLWMYILNWWNFGLFNKQNTPLSVKLPAIPIRMRSYKLYEENFINFIYIL